MRFADPLFLLLLVVPAGCAPGALARAPPAAGRADRVSRVSPSSPALRSPGGARWPWLPEALRMLGLALLMVALARPQVPHEVRQIRSKSRNIMLALDISSSMKAGDFKPGNRLMVARQVLADFSRERKGDLLGLVIFAGRAFLQAPLTPDTDLLDRMLGRVDIGMLPDGTAIGTALAMCLNQVKDLPATASVIVLITDGANNTGKPSPLVAAEAARAIGVRIHTIGVSAADTTGPDRQFIWRWGGRTPDRLTSGDEAILKRISDRSGGRYFRATDPEALAHILSAIDPIERREVKISETRDYRELYAFALAPALVLLAAGLVLGATRLRSVPMSFAWPLVLLLGAVLVPLAVRAMLAGLRRRDAELRAFGEPEVLGRGSALGDQRTARRRVWLQVGRARTRRARPGAPAARRAPGRAGADRPGPAGGAGPLALDDRGRRGAEPTGRGEGRGVGDGLRLARRPGGPHRVRRQRLSPAPAHLGPRDVQAVPRCGEPGRPRRSRDRYRHGPGDGRQGVRARGRPGPPRRAARERRRERRGRSSGRDREPPRGRDSGVRPGGRHGGRWGGAGRQLGGAGEVPPRPHRPHRDLAAGRDRAARGGQAHRRRVRACGPRRGPAGVARRARQGAIADALDPPGHRARGSVSVAARARGGWRCSAISRWAREAPPAAGRHAGPRARPGDRRRAGAAAGPAGRWLRPGLAGCAEGRAALCRRRLRRVGQGARPGARGRQHPGAGLQLRKCLLPLKRYEDAAARYR